MFATYTVIEYMSTQKGGNGGVIVNIASMAGIDFNNNVAKFHLLPIAFAPIPGNEPYSASKAGLLAFTRSMAQVLQA